VEADRCTRFRGISHHGERSKQVLNLTTAQGSAVARRSEPSPVFSLHSLSSHEVGKGVVASAHFLNKLKSPFLKSGQVKLRARARALLEPFISESRSRSAAAGSCMSHTSSLASLAGHTSCQGGATGACLTPLEACGSPDCGRGGFVFLGSVPAEQHGTEGSCLLGAASCPQPGLCSAVTGPANFWDHSKGT
jgi:hypothetical protein